MKAISTNNPENITYRIGADYCDLQVPIRDALSGKVQTLRFTYLKPNIGLVLDRHISSIILLHADAGLNYWAAGNGGFGSVSVGAGIGISHVMIRAGYDYGLGRVKSGYIYDEAVHASTFSLGLIIYPTGAY